MASPDLSGATPEVAVTGYSGSATWVPQGNGVLVTWDDTLTYVDVEGGRTPIDTGGVDGRIMYAAASPKGNQILAQVEYEDSTQGGYLIEQPSGDAHQLRALHADPGFGITGLEWLPSGNGVVFVEGEIVDGAVVRGQLFSYLFGNEVPSLIATSGQGGPSATIANVTVSPDGYSVAYEVSILDLDRWSVHSVWIRSLKQDVPPIQVPVNSGEALTRLAWSSEGLVWSQEGGSEVRVMRPTGETGDLGDEATPVASPVVMPVISAVPVATPVGTPVPVG
jgi:hypothetical protein